MNREDNERFEEWLNETYHTKISLRDLGQDMQCVYIDQNGEILHCDFHSEFYNGLFVDLSNLKVNKPLRVFLSNQDKIPQILYSLIIEQLEQKTKT